MKKEGKRWMAVLLTGAMAAGCFGGSVPAMAEESETTLRVGIPLDVLGNMDVMITSQNTVFQISDTITDTLMAKRDEDLELYPQLLEDFPEVSEDGLTYTCKFRQGVKFHDGTELTADDVIFTFNRFF